MYFGAVVTIILQSNVGICVTMMWVCCLYAKCGVCRIYNVCHPKNYVSLYDIIYRQQCLVKRREREEKTQNLGLSISIDLREINIIETYRKKSEPHTLHNKQQRNNNNNNEEKHRRHELSVTVSRTFFVHSKRRWQRQPFF